MSEEGREGGSSCRIVVFKERRTMVASVVRKWREISRDAVEKKGFFAAGLSGGNTPEGFYRGIAEQGDTALWDKTYIFLVDERFVPDTHKDSNYRMIRETFLKRVSVPAENIHPIPTVGTDPVSAARKYEEEMSRFFGLSAGELPEFDLLLLGIGRDGHTASLFPGSVALSESRSLVSAVFLDEERHDRITLTLPVINNARNIFFLVTGRDKAEALRGVIEKKNTGLPASLVMPRRGSLLILADFEAATLLSEKEYERG